MSGRSAAFQDAILDERARSTRTINLLRLLAVVGGSLADALLEGYRQPYIGPPAALFAAWLVLAAGVLWLSWRSDRWARGSVLFVPLVDMPLILALCMSLVRALRQHGVPGDVPGIAVLGGMLWVLMIFLTAGLLDRWQSHLTVSVAVVSQLVLSWYADLDSGMSVFAVLGLFFASMLAQGQGSRVARLVATAVQEQRHLDRLHRYFSPRVVEYLGTHVGSEGTAATHEVTLLFADLRDFTSMSEGQSGHGIVKMLNEFHQAMVDTIFEHGGTLDKYLGDGLIAYFGAPMEQLDHASRAVHCAVAMQSRLDQLNLARIERREPALRMGIGVHSGSVLLGDIGAEQRREFTVIGHAVNVASRIESLTKQIGVGVLVSEATCRAVGGVGLDEVGAFEIRGQSDPVRVFVPVD